jgi:autotransporter-associated beta strand protein
MPDSPFTTIGDEALEARIVAWVLGEASAFEAAELERLCDERPELMIFKRRMLALHGLLTEAEKTDDSWKLPPEKRKAVGDILGEATPIRLEVVKEKHIRRSGRRALLAIAACVVITFFIARLQPWKHTSEAIIEVKPRQAGMSPLGAEMTETSGASRLTPQFFGSEHEKIRSRNNLERVVDKLDLADRWDMDKEQAVAKLKDSVKTENVRGTDLMKIKVRQSDKKEADEIARELAYAYKDYRTEIEARDAERQLQALNKAVRDQEDKVEERRKVLATIVRNKGIIYKGQDSLYNQGSVDEDQGDRNALQTFHEIEQEKLQLESQISSLSKYDGEQRMVYAGGLNLPDNEIRELYPKYQEARRQLDAEKIEGLGDKHPSVQAKVEQAETLKRHLDEGVVNLRATLQAQLNLANARLKSLEVAKNESREEAIKRGLDAQDYVDAQRDFEADQKLLQEMKLKQIGETISRKIPAESVVIHELPGSKSTESETQALASNSPARMMRLETSIPAERIEGTPKPIILPGQKPVGASELVDASTVNKKKQERLDQNGPAVSSSPVSGRGLDSRTETLARNGSGSLTLPGGGVSGKASGYGGGGGFGRPMEETSNIDALAATGPLDDDAQPVEYNLRDPRPRVRADSSLALNQPKPAAQPAPASEIAAADESIRESKENASVLNGLRSDNAMELSGANSFSGGTAVNAGKLGIASSSSRFESGNESAKDADAGSLNSGAAFPATPATPEAQAPADSSMLLAEGQAKRRVSAKGTGETNEYLFRAEDLGKEDARVSENAETAAPKPDLSKLIEEIPASEEPYSTFSLNISDASFRIAQAALARGEQPDPAGIKVEQFYNAVDYGDPAPAAGEPVACTIEQAAHPVIPGRNLVRVALKTAAAGRSAAQPLRLTLLVDQSGSMVREDRRTAMNKALAGLSELLTGNDIVTVIGFSRTPRLLADGMPGDKAGKLADLINIEASEGGTNLEEAIKLGEKMADRRKQAGAQNRIVLFTDGAANLGDADPERLAQKVKQLRQKGISFDIAGIAAEDLNDDLLGELARNGNGRYYIVGKGGDDNFAKQLAGAFRPAAENVKVQVRFNPERVGRYKLIGFEKDRLKTEDFRNDKVDAAELAAEEAGVAIYQVETLPEGHGELGEVSVRFRDTARNEMVERTWTISHDSGAPAIDRATPSMQLATLAMLAGEKLKGGPLADAIDFKQLTTPAANVKQLYGNTGRVGEVLRMVDALK